MDVIDIIERYHYACREPEWTKDNLGSESIVLTTIGQVAVDIYPDRTPVAWLVRVMAFEGEGDEPREEGTASTVSEAKAEALQAARAFVPAMLEFLLT